jgi:hypothetical protein
MLRLRGTAAAAASTVLRIVEQATTRLVGSPTPVVGAADPFAGLLPFELTSARALRVPWTQTPALAPTGVDVAYASLLLDFAGVCTFEKAVALENVERCRVAAVELSEELRERVRARGVDPDGLDGFSFVGVHQRDPGRMDVRNHPAMGTEPFAHATLGDDAPWMPVIKSVLGDNCRRLWKGFVVTEPGTADQAYHPDGPPVPREVWEAHEPEALQQHGALPAHCLTVFVPLVSLVDGSPGATKFLPGSHHEVLNNAAMHAEAEDPGSTGGAGSPATLHVAAGDAIIFNNRVRHAGSANTSGSRRPLLYLVFGRDWYTEDLHRQLLEDGGFAEPGGRVEPL